jgi:Ino eighty subunit 1
MASDNDTGSPAQDYNSPAPSQGLGRSLQRSKGAGSVRTDDQYDSDRTRSASPSGSLAALPLPKPSTGMNINTLLNNDSPTPPATAAPAASAPAQVVTPAPTTAPAKGPGRGNWGHRRKENHGGAGSSAAVRSLARAQQHASEEPDSSSFAGSRPHGFYLPLNGAVVEPKRSRPLTSHQLAVERYRKERVDFILDRGIRKSHTESKKKRVKEGALLRTWRRCNALPNGFDSEEEDLNSDSVPAREGVAARALLMMASLRPSPWEQSDWGEEAGALASGMRRVRRRTERWETGEPVVRRKYEDGGERLAPVESMEGK